MQQKEMSTNELVALFKQEPEIKFRLEYYREIMKSIDDIISSIDNRLSKGVTKENYWVFYIIPISRRNVLDKYDKAKLKREKYELQVELFSKREYYERWLNRSYQYENEFQSRYTECLNHYEWLYAEAVKVSAENPRLAQTIDKYKNPNNDRKIKLEFYLYIKSEVQNWYAHNHKRFFLQTLQPVVEKQSEAILETNKDSIDVKKD